MYRKIASMTAVLLLVHAVLAAETRIKKFQEEIEELSRQLEVINKSETGILGQLRKYEAERRLREAELRQIAMSIADTEQKIETNEKNISETAIKAEEARRYLSDTLTEIYKLGKLRHYRILLSAKSQTESLLFFQYASYLADKDAKQIRFYRECIGALRGARSELKVQQEDLVAKREMLAKKEELLRSGESSQRNLLESIREKKEVHREAISELRNACDELEKLVNSFGKERDTACLLPLNARKFKGLFARPSRGNIKSSFGMLKHPRFRTELPHNGLDIDAPFGSDIRAVFDGRIAFAEWFKGYGLTIIVDHGSGILSIYAHASAILVETGEIVNKGSVIGKVGDSGSLQGPYLYFEMRDNGKAVDPEGWLLER